MGTIWLLMTINVISESLPQFADVLYDFAKMCYEREQAGESLGIWEAFAEYLIQLSWKLGRR